MQQPEIPKNEKQRLAALLNSALLDTDAEPRFDRLTSLVQQCLATEIVLVSLVDTQRQWFKSRQGLNACETNRDISFCGHAILADDIFEVSDASQDVMFADNPLVTHAPFIRFYAGAPLHFQSQRIGTLCIIDPKPRQLSLSERHLLRQFADVIEQEIADRLQQHSQQQLAASELMYRSVLEGTRIGTWQWNVQTGETVFNERWAEIVGYGLDELAPIDINTWLSLAHPDDLAASGKLLEQHFSGELAFYDCKCRMKHKNGHWVWVHDRGQVVSWTADNKPLMMYGTHADITEQKQAELALKASRDQFQTLVANIPGITYRCKADKHWTMLYMSGSIDPLSGYPATDFINNSVRSYASVIHPDDHERLDLAVGQAINDKQSWLLQYRVMHKSGAIRWVEERGRAEYNEQGEVSFLDGFILDITEEKTLKQQLLKLTSQLPGVVYQYQQWPDGRACFPYASANIQKIYGALPEQVKDDATAIFGKIYPDDLAGLANSIELSAANLSLWQHQYRVCLDNKKTIWVSGRATPESIPDGSTLWHGYIEDITTSKQHYLELERLNKEYQLSQQRLEMASETALIGFWQASLKTGELWWSPVIYQIFGFDSNITPSVALFKSTLHPDDRHLVAESEQRALQSGLHDVVHRIIRPDGNIRWVHELARLLPAGDSPDQVLVGSVQDVTERMQLQQMKDAFISTVSHELRTPLTAIKGALGLLHSGKLGQLPEKVQKLIEVANSNSERLAQLINDLLDVEKLAAGKMPFDIQPLLVQAELQQAVDNLQPFAGLHQATIALQPIVAGLKVQADSLRLQQVLTNLLSNAIKFSPKQAKVLLTAKRQQNKVLFEIVDCGAGIPVDFQSHIFERFAQADGSNQRQSGGTGLGLAICKELVQQMGGNIGFDSVPGKGTTFYFALPVKPDTIN
ncbi:transcriptional regulator [Arsukibacterium ikkense]|uniref:histidine kinase n=1 Tax=Arsukibacterium ikkense TaxID=336831 RepID=A0A0M2VA01_9GAMM|nr:PAS domain-containing protein [Arsukibacterium ikkense]KKO47436.1 transcriptional regulator [Arsukibacterium ikkense]